MRHPDDWRRFWLSLVMSAPLQTHGTCWFYTILNGFILSDAGKAILYKRMTEFFNGLNQGEREAFLRPSGMGCPAKHRTFSQLHFWKFIDQYICQYRRNRQVPLQAKTSPELLRTINKWNNNNSFRNSFGSGGAFTHQEVFSVLRSIGLGDKYQKEKGQLKNEGGTIPPDKQFIILGERYSPYKVPKVLRRSGFKFSLSHCAFSVTVHEPHAVTGFVSGGHGYLYDSNQQRKYACQWWDPKSLALGMRRLAQFYPDRKANMNISFDYIVWTKDAFVSRVHMTCKAAANTMANVPLERLGSILRASPRTVLQRVAEGKLAPARARRILVNERNTLNLEVAKMLVSSNIRMGQNVINKVPPSNRKKLSNYITSYQRYKRAKERVNRAGGMYARRALLAVYRPVLDENHYKQLQNFVSSLNNVLLTSGTKRKSPSPKNNS